MKKYLKKNLAYYLFVFPAVLAFILVVAIPFILGIIYSFTNWKGYASGSINFIGLQNYVQSLQDNKFIYSVIITVIFGLLNFLFINLVSFSLALMVSSKLKGRNLYRTGFFVPNLVGGLVLGYIWQFIFNSIIPMVGSNIGNSFLANTYFLSNSKLAVVALIFTSTWQYAGYIMMIYYTALQGVSKDLIESSSLDGANYLQRLKNIIIPSIMPAFTISLFLTLASSFQQYDVIVSLTGGGPAAIFNGQSVQSTELLAVNIYNTASVQNQMGQSQARAVMFFVALALISVLQTSITKRKEIES